VLDAGCGTGTMAVELAARGAQVVAADISPALIDIARKRAPEGAAIHWHAGDMLDESLGQFDHILAMDSMIYYAAADVAAILNRAEPRLSGKFVFTMAPRTPALMAMWQLGRLFPRSDRSPVMVPQTAAAIAGAMRAAKVPGRLAEIERVHSGFYISTALAFEGRRA